MRLTTSLTTTSKSLLHLDGHRRSSDILATLAAVLSTLFFLTRASHGLWFRSWGDELEHLLGGWALSSGDRLYVSFVDLHGPFTFFLAKSYGDLFGWAQGNYIRLVPVAFLLLAALAIGSSPSLPTLRQRSWAVTLFVGFSATVWIVQGLYLFEYYLVSGALLTVVLACYSVPSWRGLPISLQAALLSGVSAMLAVFTSHAWLPTAGALFLSTLPKSLDAVGNKASAAAFAAAGVITTAACLAWLWTYGSIRGYLVFHVIFAHTVYLEAVRPVNPELTLSKFCLSLVPSFAPNRLVQSLADVVLLLSAAIGSSLYRKVPFVIGVIGILATDARGNVGFQDGTFLIMSVALFALTLAQVFERAAETWRGSTFATLSCLFLVVSVETALRHAVSSPNSLDRGAIVRDRPVRVTARSDDAEFSFIRTVVRPDERMLALVYRPGDYWLSGRLPMRGFYEYLPDDALYASRPTLGIKRDLCTTMRLDPPPVVIFDDWKVWGHYTPDQYMPCVVRIIHDEYTPSRSYPTLFVRNDRMP